MVFSPLISGTVPHHGKYSSRQGSAITRINQHHWAGMAGGDVRLMSPTEKASATYIIRTNGTLWGQVPEEYRPWTTSTAAADNPAITIEVQNINGRVNGSDDDPNSWQISDAALNMIIQLLADCSLRYGWGPIDKSRYRGHREFHSTACPGGYLWSRMASTRASANLLLGGQLLIPAGAAAVAEKPVLTPDQKFLEDLGIALP